MDGYNIRIKWRKNMNSYVNGFFESCKKENKDELVPIQRIRKNVSGSLARGLLEILITARSLNVPRDIEMDAHKMLYQLSETGFFEGRSVNAIANACLLISCEENDHPIVPRELADRHKLSPNKIYTLSQKIKDGTGVVNNE